jgi:hypothetical protein
VASGFLAATYRLIKDDGHAAHIDYVGDVFLRLPRLFPGYCMQGLGRIVRSAFRSANFGFELGSSGALYRLVCISNLESITPCLRSLSVIRYYDVWKVYYCERAGQRGVCW